MLRVFLILNLLFLNIYACKGGYDSCKRKIIDSKTIQNQNLIIPITKKQKLIYTSNPSILKNYKKIIKSDPLLGLYLVEDKKSFRYPFRLNRHHSLGVAAVDKSLSIEGKIERNQLGLNSLASFSDAQSSPSLLLTSCCSLEGIVTPRGIIQKVYIKRFLNSTDVTYGDIGVRLKDKKTCVVVSASNPFIKNNSFKKGDCILEFDGKKVKSSSTLMQKILFSKVGTTHKVKIKRDSKILNIKVVTAKRYGGGLLSDTFLEHRGIYFDKTLHIIKISKYFKEYGLILGDQLLQVNGVKVQNQQELLEYIADFKDFSALLFERRHFQFFVHIN